MMEWSDEMLLFNEGFHVGMRKALDSLASVFIWNILHLLEVEEKHAWIKDVVRNDADTLKEKCLTENATVKRAKPTMNILRVGMEMLSDSEWDAMEKWLGLCNGEDDD